MQNADRLVRLSQVFNEKTTAIIVIQFLDDAGAPVVPVAATWTLYDWASGAVINNRSTVAMSVSGATGTVELTPADMLILDAGKNLEEHRVYAEYTYSGTGSRAGSVEIQVPVVNVRIK